MKTNRAAGVVIGLMAVATLCAQLPVVAAGLLPAVPWNPTPIWNSTNIATPKIVTWVSIRATSFDVYFGTTSTPPKVATVVLPAYTPLNVKAGTKYFWKVVAKNAVGGNVGPVWTFTTKAAAGTSAPAPTPVNCVLSNWVMTSASSWSACSTSGQQTRTELWTRTISVAPSNGGSACGPLTENRVGTQSCTPPGASQPPPPSPPPPSGGIRRLTQADLSYVGAFRVPSGTGTASFLYGGTAIAYHPGNDSLLMVGHDHVQQVGEMNIPVPGTGAKVTDLPRATFKQPLTDVLQGKLFTIDGDTQNGVKIGGLLVLPNSLVVSAWSYYDAGPTKQTRSHFVTGQNFSSLGGVNGPFQVGNGFQNVVPSDATRIGGFVSGYMATIPTSWQSALGGTHLTGQGGRVSILGRTSSGPSATVFTPSELGVPNTPTSLVMGYPSDSSNPASPLHHPTLGVWGQNGGLYNGTQGFRGMVFPDGTRSILYFGWGAASFCYGVGTADAALHQTPVPGSPGVIYCFDPAPGQVNNKGTHAYPTLPLVFAYDVDDFIAVKQGLKKAWEVVPYATWNFTLPFQSNIVNGVEQGTFEIIGAAYDSYAKRIFLSASRSDGMAPVVHVFQLP